LQNYDFDWEYVTGKSNGAADALSRQEELRLPATWECLPQLKPKALYTLSLVDYEQQTSLNLATINVISVVKPKLVSDLREAFVTDTEFSALFAHPEPPYQIRMNASLRAMLYAYQRVLYEISSFMISMARSQQATEV
jgi:hypothetical protein